MAISSNSSAKGLEASNSNLTYTHTTGAGSNIVMYLYAFCRDGDLLTGITVGGNAATFVTKQNTRNSRELYLYTITGVAASTALSVVCSVSGSPGRTECVSVAYNGAKQTTTPDATHNVASGTANPYVCTITTVADNCWVTVGVDTGTSGQSNTGCQLLQDNTPTGAMILYDDHDVAPVHPAGSTTLNVGNSGSGTNIATMASLAPFTQVTSGNMFSVL